MTTATRSTVTRCQVKCAGRHDCICDHDPNHPHTLHVCKHADCVCHSAAAFGLVKTVRRDGREVYEGAPAVLQP